MLTLGLYTSFTLPMSTVYVGEEKLPQMNFKGSGISQLFEICNKGKCCKTRCQQLLQESAEAAMAKVHVKNSVLASLEETGQRKVLTSVVQ